MAVAEKLIEAGREAGLTLINKGFSSNHGGVALIVQKDEKVANLVTVERTFEYEYRYSTTWWWSRKTLILKAAYRAHGGINLEGPEPLRIIIPAGNKGPITAEGLHGNLISCEMVEGSLRIVKDDAGIWNRLTSEDAAIAVNQLNENARKHIMESGLKHQAEEKISSNASGKKPVGRKNLPGRTAGSETRACGMRKTFSRPVAPRSAVPHSALLSCQNRAASYKGTHVMANLTFTPPADGAAVTMQNDRLCVPDRPVIPFIIGDGTGPEIWAAASRVIDAAVAKAYQGRRSIAWYEVFAGQKSFDNLGTWLPNETVEAFRTYLIGIKGPLTTPVGGGIRSLNVTLRQDLDLFVCLRPVRYFNGIETPVKAPEKVDMVVFRENTEDIYAGIEFKEGTEDAKLFLIP